MELRHLRYFLSLAQELSFVKASEKLFISQPPLSRQIKELEQELDTRLFNRNNKRVELTDAGKYFEKEVKQLFLSLDRIVLKTQKIGKNTSGEFRIAYISSTFSGDLANLLRFLSGKYPYVTFRLYEVTTTKQVLALEQGELDLGIVRAPLNSPKLKTRLWFRDSYSVVFNNKQLTIESEDEVGKLKNETFVFFNKDYAPAYYASLLEICSTYGFVPQVVHESNNIASIIQLIINGLGVSIVPSDLAKSFPSTDISFIELKKIDLYTNVLLATPNDDDCEITQAAIGFLLGQTGSVR